MSWTRIMATSGERSRPPMGGSTRRIGLRTGSVISVSIRPNGLESAGMNQLRSARTMIAIISTYPRMVTKFAKKIPMTNSRIPRPLSKNGSSKPHYCSALPDRLLIVVAHSHGEL
jgi:hypothetical protein